jgi:hypothetical protein
MTSKPKSSALQSSLLAAIQRKVPQTAATAQDPEQPPPVSEAGNFAPNLQHVPRQRAEPRKTRIGSPVQFWFHEEDRRLLRELAAWLAGQGLRPTDSMVIRAALRTAKTGGELLQAYRQASELDGRLKRHKLQ